MNTLAKVTLAIGAVVTVIGVVGFVLGSSSFAGIKPIIENASSGGVYVEDSDNNGHLGFSFYVDGDRYVDENENGQWDHCEGVNIEIYEAPQSSTGDSGFYFEIVDYGVLFFDECEAHPDNVNYNTPGKLKIGRACAGCYEGSFAFTSNTPVQVWDDEAALGGIFRGIGAICLGGGGICCGLFILILGIVFVFALEDEDNNTKLIIDGEGRVISSVNSGEYVAVTEDDSPSNQIENSVASNGVDEEEKSPEEDSVDNANWYEASDDES